MKHIFFLMIPLGVFAQCDEDHMTISVSYTPKVAVSYFTEVGLALDGGITYQLGRATKDSTRGQLGIESRVGWRIFRKDYAVSVFIMAGFSMSDRARFVATPVILFPIKQKAISIEWKRITIHMPI